MKDVITKAIIASLVALVGYGIYKFIKSINASMVEVNAIFQMHMKIEAIAAAYIEDASDDKRQTAKEAFMNAFKEAFVEVTDPARRIELYTYMEELFQNRLDKEDTKPTETVAPVVEEV